jgi:hypothetical protein
MLFKIGNNVWQCRTQDSAINTHTVQFVHTCSTYHLKNTVLWFNIKVLTHIQSKKHQWFNETYSHDSTWEGRNLWEIQTVMSKCCVKYVHVIGVCNFFFFNFPSTSTCKHLTQLSYSIIYCKIFLSIKIHYKRFQPLRALCCKLQQWNYIMHCTDNGHY